MRIEIRLFANLREKAGTGTLFLEFGEPPTVGQVVGRVAEECPLLKEVLFADGGFDDRYKVLVGSRLVYPERFSERITEGESRVAILPPVSGG